MFAKNKISPSGLFFLLFISRLVVALTALSSKNFGSVSTDLLISITLSIGFTITLALPVIFCYRKNKSPFDIKWLGALYALYFIFMAAVNVSEFSYFASTTLSPETRAWVFILIISVCAFYCTRLGIEPISRFCAFAFFMILVGLIVAVVFNFQNYQEINLYPVINNSTASIAKNTAIITANSTELIVFLCLKDRVNGRAEKSFVSAIVAALFSIFMLVLFMLAVMGDGVTLESFPLYTFFQITKFDRFQRLDVFHISFWIMGSFIKAVLFQYCACISVRSIRLETKNAFSAALVALLSFAMLKLGITGNINPLMIIIPFCAFCVAIPLATVIFKKKNSGDELIERL